MPTPPITDMYRLPFPKSTFGARWGVVDADHPTPHRGTDFMQPVGTPIPAVATGIVVFVGHSDVLGYVTVIATRLRKLHEGSRTLYIGYCHQSRQDVKLNQVVRRGQHIGLVGNTGSASHGAHLHLTFSYESAGVFYGTTFDPLPFIDAHDHLS
jgi:murein DD-endopeptidase MepM/ murein hydrolase activator NlpD